MEFSDGQSGVATPVLLPGKSHGRRSLVGCSPWGREELDTTERLHFHFPLSCIGEGNGNPLQCSCLENPRDGGAWWAAVYGVIQSRTRSDLAAVWCRPGITSWRGISRWKWFMMPMSPRGERHTVLCHAVPWEEGHGSELSKAGGEEREREREDLWASAFTGSQAEITAKEVRESHWCVLMSLGQSNEGSEGNLWKRPALLYWCTWSPGRGTCLWGCWGIRKIWSFKNLERRLLPKCVQFPSVSSEALNFPAIDKIPLVTYLYI